MITGLLESDEYYTSLNPRQHHIAFNMLTPLISTSQNIEDFINGSPYYHTIVSYLKGITARKKAVSMTDDPSLHTHETPRSTRLETDEEKKRRHDEFLTEFRFYFTKHSDYGDVTNDNLRAFFTHLITLPEFNFLKPPEEERGKGPKGYYT